MRVQKWVCAVALLVWLGCGDRWRQVECASCGFRVELPGPGERESFQLETRTKTITFVGLMAKSSTPFWSLEPGTMYFAASTPTGQWSPKDRKSILDEVASAYVKLQEGDRRATLRAPRTPVTGGCTEFELKSRPDFGTRTRICASAQAVFFAEVTGAKQETHSPAAERFFASLEALRQE